MDLPEITVEGNLLQYLWDFVGNNGAQIIGDMKGLHKLSNPDESPAGLFGPLDQLFIHPEAEVEPLVAFDTTKGPSCY